MKTLIRLLLYGQSDVGLHCLTITKRWELITWQFLLVVVLSFRLLMRTVIITIKRNGYIYFKFMFTTKHMVWVIKSTVAMRRFLSTQNIKPWLQIELTRLQNFVKVYTNSKNRNDSVYTHLHSISTRRITGSL